MSKESKKEIEPLVARSPVLDQAVQKALDNVWGIVDAGHPIAEVITWIEKGGHKSIGDWMCEEIVPYLRNGERKIR